jgi:hypothetical protein
MKDFSQIITASKNNIVYSTNVTERQCFQGNYSYRSVEHHKEYVTKFNYLLSRDFFPQKLEISLKNKNGSHYHYVVEVDRNQKILSTEMRGNLVGHIRQKIDLANGPWDINKLTLLPHPLALDPLLFVHSTDKPYDQAHLTPCYYLSNRSHQGMIGFMMNNFIIRHQDLTDFSHVNQPQLKARRYTIRCLTEVLEDNEFYCDFWINDEDMIFHNAEIKEEHAVFNYRTTMLE